jgi:hypothetical protein
VDPQEVTTGSDAIVLHDLEELEEVIRLRPIKRFKGETSECPSPFTNLSMRNIRLRQG